MTHEDRRRSLPPSLSSSTLLHNHLNNICTTMASEQRVGHLDEDYSLFLSENGHLSFENPNYQMASIDPSRLDDHLNSNIQPSIPVSMYEELKHELDASVLRTGSGNNSSSGSSPKSSSRRNYAQMDVCSMGVDVSLGPSTTLDNKISEEKMRDSVDKLDKFIQHSTEQLTKGEIESDKLVETSKEKCDKSDGEVDTKEEESNLITSCVKRRPKKRHTNSSQANGLPLGWERHEDDEGPYYWHVKSGNIQREPPKESNDEDRSALVRNIRSSRIFEEDFDPIVATTSVTAASNFHKSSNGTMSKSCTSSSIADLAKEKAQLDQDAKNGSADWKRRSMPPGKSANEADESKIIQVQVQSLGWVELREDELTPENSSKAVNRCIVQLSSGTNSQNEPAGQWGEGNHLSLEISDGSLKLIQPGNGLLLNSQPIHSIRVWGVGRDNGRDFAYVARDKHTRKHMCHVFRCDAPARAIANALRDICKKILIERSLAQSSSKLSGFSHRDQSGSATGSTPTSARRDRVLRPTSLGGNFNSKLQTKAVPAPESFPTPMEEPRKVMKALLLGNVQVNKPCGIDIIHSAINQMLDTIPRSEWKPVSVAVAPSTVTISFADSKEPDLDCRVRFLSFMGIGENTQHGAFIMHTAQDTFVCYVFHVEPCAGPLCKTIEAACKLRYQKCLDARPQRAIVGDRGQNPNNRGSIGATIKNMFGNWTSKNRLQSPPS
ncbi:protein Fe65 homolog [Tigriopus californicus]|uniref:protein Fe65 homolog n=1 Tax=Tigriopus californicus TaxID=6832 RepID=UPI0027DA4F78|nr:protein Fe65 homolog [Tigriopus californicus]